MAKAKSEANSETGAPENPWNLKTPPVSVVVA